jgi:hypothetical protein
LASRRRNRPARHLAAAARIGALAAALLPGPAAYADVDSQGELSSELRLFEPDRRDVTEEQEYALTSRLEVGNKHGPWQEQLRAFVRLDLDDNRIIVQPEEAFVGFKAGRVRVRVGAQLISWEATESLHPADIINSRNFESDIEDLEKIGEPMAEVRFRLFNGYLTAMYMPARMHPRLPTAASRLNLAPPGVEFGDPLWVGRDGEIDDRVFEHQGALHLSQTLGQADVSLHVVQHNDRFRPAAAIDMESGEVRPVYHMVTQVGGTYAHAVGPWVFKAEGGYRTYLAPDGDNPYGIMSRPDHGAGAVGAEYAWTTDDGHAATVFAEGQALIGVDKRERAELHPFQRDILFGYRHQLNDVNSRQLTAAFATDLERPDEYFGLLTYEQRVADVWTVELALRSVRNAFFTGIVHQGQLVVTRYF